MLRKLIGCESGQATTEYAMIVAFSIVVAIGAIYVFTDSIATFYYNVSTVVCLPVP
ncbi:MAG TPA: Flp family type IVb pilin [Planctomycetota bacterium]|nr:Flp family type IVb pilin [Planctomycetota bacterium]